VAREGAKAPNKLCDVITGAQRNREAITKLKEDIAAGRDVSTQRDTIGMAIRAWDVKETHWRVQVLYAILVDAMDGLESLDTTGGKYTIPSMTCVKFRSLTTARPEYPDMISGWQMFLDHLADMDLMEAPAIKRLVDGKELSKRLGVKAGRWMGQALDICLEWQLRNPGVSDPSPAIELVRQRAEELGITGLK